MRKPFFPERAVLHQHRQQGMVGHHPWRDSGNVEILVTRDRLGLDLVNLGVFSNLNDPMMPQELQVLPSTNHCAAPLRWHKFSFSALSPPQVLKVNLLGHRKRIIASLADRPYEEPPAKPPRFSQLRVSPCSVPAAHSVCSEHSVVAVFCLC